MNPAPGVGKGPSPWPWPPAPAPCAPAPDRRSFDGSRPSPPLQRIPLIRTRPTVVIAVCTLAFGCRATDATAPAAPVHPEPARALALGGGFTCALTDAGKAYCWGLNDRGQLGNGGTTNAGTPVAVATGVAFSALAADVTTVCGLTGDGRALCWGVLPAGMTGDHASWSATPVAVAAPVAFTALAVGSRFACALDAEGKAYCWGDNGQGQLGAVTTDAVSAAPVAVAGGLAFTTLSAGFWSACAVTGTGRAYCWGDNQFGEAGTGTPAANYFQPVLVTDSIAFRAIGAGSIHGCGAAIDGAGYCWGENRAGELGDSTGESTRAPVRVAGSLLFARIVAGRGNGILVHTCGVTTDGHLYCWGLDDVGQIGAPATGPCLYGIPAPPCVFAPLPVESLGPVTAFGAGVNHSCALTVDGVLYCWGDNASAELGDGTNVNHATPVPVLGGLSFPKGTG